MNTMRSGFRALALASLLALLLARGLHTAEAGQTLHNGIVLPRPWPPRLADFPTSVEKDPIPPPHLTSPPAVIPIDVGRQLFVDDFLIALDVRPGTRIVQPGGRDSSTVWLDLEERDPARRFKMFRVVGAGGEEPVTGWNNWVMAIHFSPDGIHWGDPVARSGRVVDRSMVFWNPYRKVWTERPRYQAGTLESPKRRTRHHDST